MLRALAIVFALAAVGCMVTAVGATISGRPGAQIGWVLRTAAVVCFAAAVALNVAAH